MVEVDRYPEGRRGHWFLRAQMISAVPEAGSARWDLLSQQSGQQGSAILLSGQVCPTPCRAASSDQDILPDGGDQQPSFILTQPVSIITRRSSQRFWCRLAQFRWLVMVSKTIEFPMLRIHQIRRHMVTGPPEG